MADAKQIIFPVLGMTCASCVGHVERALKKIEGVTNANVNLATERAAVDLTPNGIGVADLVVAVRDAGYEVPTETVTLPIGGMTCANCAGHVERALKKAEGVTNTSVNLATEKATATFIPGVANTAELRRAVADAGYEVLESPEAAAEGEEEAE